LAGIMQFAGGGLSAVALPPPDVDPTSPAPQRPAPATPSLVLYFPTPRSQMSSDSRAPLRIGNVVPRSGTLASITVSYGGRSMPVSLSTPNIDGTYDATVTGLTNGTPYNFTATVCNSFRRCSTSAPLSFTPYGMPQMPTVTGTAAGRQVSFSWDAVNRKASPWTLACEVGVTGTPADPAAPTAAATPDRPGSLSFVGQAHTQYTAMYSCTLAEWAYISVSSSNVVTIP
jgi:hypothetical protein